MRYRPYMFLLSFHRADFALAMAGICRRWGLIGRLHYG